MSLEGGGRGGKKGKMKGQDGTVSLTKSREGRKVR